MEFRKYKVLVKEYITSLDLLHVPVIQLLWRPNLGTVWVQYQLGVTVLRWVGGLSDHL